MVHVLDCVSTFLGSNWLLDVIASTEHAMSVVAAEDMLPFLRLFRIQYAWFFFQLCQIFVLMRCNYSPFFYILVYLKMRSYWDGNMWWYSYWEILLLASFAPCSWTSMTEERYVVHNYKMNWAQFAGLLSSWLLLADASKNVGTYPNNLALQSTFIYTKPQVCLVFYEVSVSICG